MNERLQIIISANVAQAQQALKAIQGEVDKTEKGSSKLSKIGEAAGNGMKKAAQVTGAAAATCTAAIGALVKSSVSNFAEYEQLVGGIDTLFKDSSAKVQQYAKDAYKNTGMSANEYMKISTSFSAILRQSLGGDTEAAAEISNMAISDMADNANKMGTSMESVQNAYQGFAKGNYTMLDNLKLGYGGTKEEMQRLLADAEKISGIHYDINNLNDVYSAIHVVQQELGITGTAAEESKKTISGSAASMKAAWTNLLTGIAQNNGNLDELISNLADTVKTFAGNVIPVIQTVLKNISSVLIEWTPQVMGWIGEMLPQLISAIATTGIQLVSAIVESLPTVIEGIMQIIPQLLQALLDAVPILLEGLIGCITAIIEGLAEILPTIVEAIMQILPLIIESLISAIPQLIEAAVQLLMAIVDAIPQIIPALVEALPRIIQTIIETEINSINLILDAAVQLFTALVDAIPLILPVLIDTFPTIIDTIVNTITENIPTILNSAINLFTAVIDAIPRIVPPLVAAIPKIIETIVSTLARNYPKMAAAALKLFLEIVKAVPKIAGQLLSALGNLMSQALTKIGSFAVSIGQKVGDGISGAVKAAINGVLSTATGIINGFIGAINGAIGVINAIPGVSISKLDKLDVPQFAKGGIVDSATLAVVGEAGKEAVVPLENNTEWIDELAKKIKGGGGGDNPPTPVILQVDGKTFAQTTIQTVNDLTRQTGRLDLVLA
jgi:phage-related protein